MDKFPRLQMYRALYSVAGFIIILAGLVAGLRAATAGDGLPFQFEVFVSIFGTAVFFGGGMVVFSELIEVIVRIEGHLDNIRMSQTQPLDPRPVYHPVKTYTTSGGEIQDNSSRSKLGTFDPPSER